MGQQQALSVSSFVRQAREHIEDAFHNFWVEGEISNFKRHSSGHCYFTLKDSDAQVRCVMWRGSANALYFSPADGMQVRLYGKASIYEKRGDLQLIAQAMRHAGEGALQKAFEELKLKLRSEGLFEASHKQPVPTFPQCIGIVTSATGAAIHDILSILERRFPLVEALIYPVQVQGMGASEAICEAIEAFNRMRQKEGRRIDVLIVGRGGGSLEDLWAFNEEAVARAIFASFIPIVSAVGHETDVTIADFVADYRAATPSMAAEIVTPDREELLAYLNGAQQRAMDAIHVSIDTYRQHITQLTQRHGFYRPLDRLVQYKQRIDDLSLGLDRSVTNYLTRRRESVDKLHRQLTLIDPMRPLKKGYAMVEQDGAVVRSAHAVLANRELTLQFHDGKQIVRPID